MTVSKDQPAVLIMDNHNSDITLEGVELAKNHGLNLLTLPPHCTHKVQPLDVALFGAFRKFYSSFCDEWHLSHPGETLSLYYVADCLIKLLLNPALGKYYFFIQVDWNIFLQFRNFYRGRIFTFHSN